LGHALAENRRPHPSYGVDSIGNGALSPSALLSAIGLIAPGGLVSSNDAYGFWY
jgi:hypothetical protein